MAASEGVEAVTSSKLAGEPVQITYTWSQYQWKMDISKYIYMHVHVTNGIIPIRAVGGFLEVYVSLKELAYFLRGE